MADEKPSKEDLENEQKILSKLLADEDDYGDDVDDFYGCNSSKAVSDNIVPVVIKECKSDEIFEIRFINF
jgi:hypothetical protein